MLFLYYKNYFCSTSFREIMADVTWALRHMMPYLSLRGTSPCSPRLVSRNIFKTTTVSVDDHISDCNFYSFWQFFNFHILSLRVFLKAQHYLAPKMTISINTKISVLSVSSASTLIYKPSTITLNVLTCQCPWWFRK